MARGNVIQLDRGTYLSVGDGIVYVNSAALSASLTATRRPKISILNTSVGTYTHYTLGMDTPVAPVLTAVAPLSVSAASTASPTELTTTTNHGLSTGAIVRIIGATGNWTPINGAFTIAVTAVDKFTIPVDATAFGALTGTVTVGGEKGMRAGSYSVRIAPGRTATGGYNNASPRADVTIVDGGSISIRYPAMDTSHGQDNWPVWVTTFADTLGADLNYLNGPWHFFKRSTGSSSRYTETIEWSDAAVEGNEILSYDNDAPVDAEFVALLNNVPVYLSCQGAGNPSNTNPTSPGPFLIPAKPTNIETAPLSLAISSSRPETNPLIFCSRPSSLTNRAKRA